VPSLHLPAQVPALSSSSLQSAPEGILQLPGRPGRAAPPWQDSHLPRSASSSGESLDPPTHHRGAADCHWADIPSCCNLGQRPCRAQPQAVIRVADPLKLLSAELAAACLNRPLCLLPRHPGPVRLPGGPCSAAGCWGAGDGLEDVQAGCSSSGFSHPEPRVSQWQGHVLPAAAAAGAAVGWGRSLLLLLRPDAAAQAAAST